MIKKTIVLTKKQESILEQIYSELLFSLKKTFFEENILELSCLIIKNSSQQTFVSKKEKTIKFINGVSKFSGKAFSITKTKISNYRQNGVKNELESDYNIIYSTLESTPEKIKIFSKNAKLKLTEFNEVFLKKSNEEKLQLMFLAY